MIAPPETRLQGPAGYPFESESFHACWWEHLAPKFNVRERYRDFAVVEHPVLKGLIRLRELRLAGFNYGWGQCLTPDRVADLDYAQTTLVWDYFKLPFSERHRQENTWKGAFKALQDLGYATLQVAKPPNYGIDLRNGFQGYLEGLSYNSRRSFKRKLKKAAAVHPEVFDITEGPEAVDRFFERFFRFHVPYWDEKAGGSYFHDPRERAFIVAWAKALQASGNLLLQEVRMAGEPVTLSLSIVMGDQLYWVLVINTGACSEYIPGIVSLYLLLERAAAQGVTRFDMGTGDYFYKEQTATEQVANGELIVTNPDSLAGRLYLAACQQRFHRRKILP